METIYTLLSLVCENLSPCSPPSTFNLDGHGNLIEPKDRSLGS